MHSNSLRIAFLGASGSLSEEAAEHFAARVGRRPELVGAPTPREVVALLSRGDVERAVLPIANSSTGLVRAALEALASAVLALEDEVVLPVQLTLWGRAGASLATIERVASHPQALRQCARSLGRLVPGAERIETADTASAARSLADGSFDARTAVLASARAGARYGLASLERDVHDEPDNRTFFSVLRRARPDRVE